MVYDFDSILDRKKTGSSKWDDLKTMFGREDLTALWKADTDFFTPPIVLEALKKRLEHPNIGYAADQSLDNITNLFKTLSNFSFSANAIFSSLGILPIIGAAIRAFSEQGDGVILDLPVYPGLRDMVNYNQREIVENPMLYNIETGEYTIDFNKLEEKITPKTKIWLLCNPHNPTGKIFTKKELQQIEQIVIKHNLIVISDEIYSFFSFSGHSYTPFASLSEETRKRTITATSGSKIFGLAGFMYALAIIPDEKLKIHFEKEFAAAGLLFSKRNTLGLLATNTAYSQENIKWLQAQIEYVHQNALFVTDFLATALPKVKVTPAEGTFVLWLNFNALNLSLEELRFKMINEAKIAMNDGETFGEDYKGFYRLNLGCSRLLLEEACIKLQKTFQEF